VIGDLEIISDGIPSRFTFENHRFSVFAVKKVPIKVLDPTERRENCGSALRVPWWRKGTSPLSHWEIWPNASALTFEIIKGRKMSRQPNSIYNWFQNFWAWMATKGDFSKDVRDHLQNTMCPKDAGITTCKTTNVDNALSMLMEIALQPCWMLRRLHGSQPYNFRNGSISPEFGWRTGKHSRFRREQNFREEMTSPQSVTGFQLLLHTGETNFASAYTFELSIDGHLFYKGNSSFGFFYSEGMAAQGWLGLKEGKFPPVMFTENCKRLITIENQVWTPL